MQESDTYLMIFDEGRALSAVSHSGSQDSAIETLRRGTDAKPVDANQPSGFFR